MNIDDDKLPDDPFGNEDDRSIEDLIREDREAAEAEDDILNSEKGNGRTKKIVFAGVGALATAGIVTAAFLFNPLGGDQTVGEKEPGTVVNTSDGGGENPNDEYDMDKDFTEEDENDVAALVNNDEDFYLQQGKFFPIEKEEWQQSVYTSEISTEQRGPILYSSNGTSLKDTASTLPFEAAGYTSDDSKALLEDGTINPEYSYWTAEGFISEVSVIQERLLNPTFGEWSLIQYPGYAGNKSYDPSTLEDLFTTRYLQENSEKAYSEYIPIYADWNGDNYGGMDNLLETGPRWYGEITSSNYEFVYDEETSSYVVNMTAEVKYTAWAKDQSKLEKNGNLTIKFVANANGAGESDHKVLIDSASLKVE